MTERSLLPPRASTRFLRAFEQATAYEPRVASNVDVIRDVKGRKLPSWLAYLLFEKGLIELTPYVSNYYTLLDEGPQWQIERDTWAAVHRGLGWVVAPGNIVEAPTRRVWWNSFQIYLDNLPPTDFPDLERIEKIVGMSSPFRSDFRRGVNGYDIPALEGDATRLDRSRLDSESGVRLYPGGPKWSFGRLTEREHVLTSEEGVALGNWLEPVSEAAYSIDLINLTATLDGVSVPFEDATNFSRASKKWHFTSTGGWVSFENNIIATTDAGTSIEASADRLSMFVLNDNPLDDDIEALIVDASVDDPFGGMDAIRVGFNGTTARTLLVPCSGLLPNAQYSVSFFARLISASGIGGGSGGSGFQNVFGQLVQDEWVRVEGVPFTTGSRIDGQWLDLTLDDPGASLTVDLFGFQVEAGPKVTSPISGTSITGHRDADLLTLLLPDGLNNLAVEFDDGSAQSILQVVGPFSVVPASLSRPVVVSIANSGSARWASMTFPWDQAAFPWLSDAKAQRAILLAQWFDRRDAYLRLRNQAGEVIGYRRCRIVRQASPSFTGPLYYGSGRYIGAESGTVVFLEAITDAGNGAGQNAKFADVVFGGALAAGIKPGKLWLDPGSLIGGVPIAAKSIDLPLRATVRERVKILLRF